jgi:hypothetical protein
MGPGAVWISMDLRRIRRSQPTGDVLTASHPCFRSALSLPDVDITILGAFGLGHGACLANKLASDKS